MVLFADPAAAEQSQHVPKVAFVAPPADYIASSDREISAKDIDLNVRALSMGKLHHAMMGTAAVAIGTASTMRPLHQCVTRHNEELEVAQRMRQRQHAGFSVHNQIRVKANNAEGRMQLARYMIRNPFALEKMTYDKQTGMVISRS